MRRIWVALAVVVAAAAWSSAQQSVTSFTLMNADTDLPIAGHDPFVSGASIDLATLPTRNLNIRANTSPYPVGSLRFDYDGAIGYQLENGAPYALAKDTSGDFWPWTPSVGSHTLTGTPFTEAGAAGTAGTSLTINFTVADSGGGGGGGGGGGTGAWIESGGMLVMEAENAEFPAGWKTTTVTPPADATMGGFLGGGYVEWTGAQYSGLTIADSAANAVVTYTFVIATEGDYTFRWRSKQYSSVSAGDAGNDTFFRFADGTVPAGAYDFSQFVKVWVQSKTAWSWQTTGEPAAAVFYANNMKRHYPPGVHSIQLAARSPGHAIDRIVLHHSSVPFNETTFNNASESDRQGAPETMVYAATTDFPIINSGEVPYYKDTARNALAIDAANTAYRGKFARAQTPFAGVGSTYDVTITSLRELDGECTYRFLVNGAVKGSAQNSSTTTDYAPQSHTFAGITIASNDTIAVESNTDSNGLVPEGAGFAWARGRWTTLTLVPSSGGGGGGGSDPVADAGVDKAVVLPSTSVVLNGSGTDDGSIAAYGWSQVSGPNTATLSDTNTASLTASGLIEGSYVFRLTVTDDEGNTGSDDVIVTVTTASSAGVVFTGELRQWHKVTLTLDGPSTSEGATPNPFTDYRMNVTFTHPSSGLSYVVPGYFAADGNAANTGATAGNQWRAHLSPDHTGLWNYSISFRSGANVAVGDAAAGAALAPHDGKSGSFTVAESDKPAEDFRTKGRLTYAGSRYLKHAGDGTAFIKTGADAPENFLSYNEFDNTYNRGGTSYLKSWSPHVGDWESGDPTWNGGKGKGIIGAINYLASEGQNVFSFLTYNAGGDSDDVWPFTAPDNPLRYDCSRLDQWEIVFEHGQNKGMYLHVKTQETENDNGNQWALDNGDVGTERKLYYRELVARFGHHLALNWNLGEENSQTEAQEKAMAQYFHDTDPYHHNIVLHTFPGEHYRYDWHLGTQSKLTGCSIQTAYGSVHADTLTQINNSTGAGRPWVVANDEQGPANYANPPDNGWPGYSGGTTPSQAQMRQNVVWGNLMAGGAGIELYAGYQNPESDLTLQNFRSRDRMWDYCRFAKHFFNNHLPFSQMVNANGLIGNSANNNSKYCFAKADSVYAIYLPSGGTTTLNLSAATGQFVVKWFDPRNGGDLLDGSVATVNGGGTVSVGNPPNNSSQDWAVLVCRAGEEYNGENRRTTPIVNAGADQTIVLPANSAVLNGSASDNGTIVSYAWAQVSGPGAATLGATNAATLAVSNLVAGTYVFRLTATDDEGHAESDTASVIVKVNTVPAITTTILPSGKVTVPYSEQIARTSGDAPFTWSIAAGGLPDGLSLGNDGMVSGTPTTIGTNTFTVRVADQQGDSDEQALTIAIEPEPNTETFVFNPIDDAYLESGVLNNNTLLKIENGRRIAYLKFNVSGLSGDLVSATLSMKCDTDGGNGTINLYKGSHNSWTEADLSTANAPAAGAKVGEYAGTYAVGTIYTADVAPLLDGLGDATYSIVAEMASGGNDAWFSSSEGAYEPVLEIVVDHGTIIGHRPVVDAGQDITVSLPDNQATLGGSASDHEGAVSIQWTQLSGPNSAVLVGATNATLTAAGLIAGEYVFEIMATDSDGNTAKDSAKVTVTDPGSGGGETGAWIESGGLVVMEAEHAELVSSWVARPTTYGAANAMAGSLGDGWLEWTGAQYSGLSLPESQVNAILTFTFEIQTAGDYYFRWRSKQYNNVSAGDAGNDTFVSLTSGTPVSGFQDFSNFTKVWVQSQTAWSWQTTFEPVSATFYANANVRRHYEAGRHTIRLAARSPGHAIDRIVLHHSSVPFNEANFENAPESARVGDSGDPVAVAGSDQVVSLPNNHITLHGSATDFDGTISAYAWTQLSGPNAALLSGGTTATLTASNLVLGTYVFELTVTDNEGNTGSDSVAVVVQNPAPPLVRTVLWEEDFDSASPGTSSGVNQTLAGADFFTANGILSEVVAAPAAFTTASGNAALLSTLNNVWGGVEKANSAIDLSGYNIQPGAEYKLSFDIYIPVGLAAPVGGIFLRWADDTSGNGPFDYSQEASASGVHHFEYAGTFPMNYGSSDFIPTRVWPIIYFHQDGAVADDHVYIDNILFEIGPTPASTLPSYQEWAAIVGLSGADADPSLDLDQDGLTNMEEYLSGFDPMNASSVFAVESVQMPGADGLVVQWESMEHRIYTILMATNLVSVGYQVVADNIAYPRNSYTVDVGQATGYVQVGVRLSEGGE